MNWYTASLFLEATHELESVPTRLWEQKIVLLRATDDDEAEAAAIRIGKDSEHEYLVAEPQEHMLRWRFIAVESVYQVVGELEVGVELFSKLLGPNEAKILLEPPPDD
jgi:Domain of unknown function (DUF4288)